MLPIDSWYDNVSVGPERIKLPNQVGKIPPNKFPKKLAIVIIPKLKLNTHCRSPFEVFLIKNGATATWRILIEIAAIMRNAIRVNVIGNITIPSIDIPLVNPVRIMIFRWEYRSAI